MCILIIVNRGLEKMNLLALQDFNNLVCILSLFKQERVLLLFRAQDVMHPVRVNKMLMKTKSNFYET